MKAVFEVKTVEADWKPPFAKNITTEVYTVSQNEEFDRIQGNGNNEAVFRLLTVQGDHAKIQFSKLFTLKENTGNAGKDKTVTIPKGHEEVVSYLWGEKGITKKIVFKGFSSTELPRFQDSGMEETRAQNAPIPNQFE
ncbi:MAG TPA: hypothetical protein VFF13_01690 [archaeon]|nr:hypothetical protein [archaeon]